MISVVVPIFNEEELIRLFHAAVADAMNDVGEAWEVVYVNDGSRDSSLLLLRELQAEDSHVVVVDLSRNWGHMGAISAGLQTARGDGKCERNPRFDWRYFTGDRRAPVDADPYGRPLRGRHY